MAARTDASAHNDVSAHNDASAHNGAAHRIASALAEGVFTKVICGLSMRDPAIVERIATLFTLAGATALDVALDEAVVAAAKRGIQAARRLEPTRVAPVIMVSVGIATDPHIGSALLHPSICATCAGCVIEDLRSCAERPLEVRAPECPSCMKCESACPHGALRFAMAHSSTGDAVAAALALGAGAVELHIAGATQLQTEALYNDVAPRCHSAVWLSFSVGATVDDTRGLLEKAAWARRLGRNVLLQVEGKPMRGDDGSGCSDEQTILACKTLLDGGVGVPLQLAGGTSVATRSRAEDAGVRASGIAFGTAARMAVSGALRGPFGPAQPTFVAALSAARALIAAGQPKRAHL